MKWNIICINKFTDKLYNVEHFMQMIKTVYNHSLLSSTNENKHANTIRQSSHPINYISFYVQMLEFPDKPLDKKANQYSSHKSNKPQEKAFHIHFVNFKCLFYHLHRSFFFFSIQSGINYFALCNDLYCSSHYKTMLFIPNPAGSNSIS